jgi:hypothetical protein
VSHIRVLVCRVDDPATEVMTEVACFDLPMPDIGTLQATTALDDRKRLPRPPATPCSAASSKRNGS